MRVLYLRFCMEIEGKILIWKFENIFKNMELERDYYKDFK